MPRTLRPAVERKNLRLPKPMMDKAQEICERHPELYNNRQQFCEDAIRRRIDEIEGR